MCEHSNVSVNTHACLWVCGSPLTNSPENRKKCGEKSVWTKIINIQWWRSDLFLSFCCMSFLWVKPAVVWRDTTPSGTDNMRDNDHTSTRTSAILHSLHLSIFPFNKRKPHPSLQRKCLFLTFNASNLLSYKWASHIDDTLGQFARHKHTVLRIVWDCCCTELQFSVPLLACFIGETKFIGPVSDWKWVRNRR